MAFIYHYISSISTVNLSINAKHPTGEYHTTLIFRLNLAFDCIFVTRLNCTFAT